ncbi:MAG: hypothetical protein WA906_01530 [Pacificimonas sp.]
MRNYLSGALIVAATMLPLSAANALIVTSNSVAGANSADTGLSTPGVLAADIAFDGFANGVSTITLDVELEAADIGPSLALNGIVDNLTGLNLTALDLTLDGTTFSAIGSVVPGFSAAPTIIGGVGDQSLSILFADPGEGFGADLGDVGFGGADFGIDIGSFVAGDSFSLKFNAVDDVSAPGALGLMLLGVAGLGWARARRAS